MHVQCTNPHKLKVASLRRLDLKIVNIRKQFLASNGSSSAPESINPSFAVGEVKKQIAEFYRQDDGIEMALLKLSLICPVRSGDP